MSLGAALDKLVCMLQGFYCPSWQALRAGSNPELVPMIPREDRPLLEASQKRIVRVKDLPQRTL